MAYPKHFFYDEDQQVSETFTTPLHGIGPKDQAKACILGGDVPQYFLHASSYDSGAKFFMVDQLHPWMDNYVRKPHHRREEYEVLTDVFPLKLFFDLEFNPQYNPHVSMMKCIALLHDAIAASLKRTFAHYEILQLHANRCTKTSTHLIYPTVVFRTMAHMHHFLWNILLPSLPLGMFEVFNGPGDTLDHVIDTCVYSKDRLFRMYGSKKGKHHTPLLPAGAKPTDPLDKFILAESLVSFPTQLDNMIEYTLRLPTYVKEPLNETYYHFVRDKLQIIHPRVQIRPCRTRGTHVDVHLVPGIHCSIARRKHKHNTTYFSVNVATGRGWYQCTDPSCRADSDKGKFGKGYIREMKIKNI